MKHGKLTQLIARRVREVRTGRQMTTTYLGRKVGVSQAQISRLENGQQGFRSGTLEKIAKALKVDPVVLVTDDPIVIRAAS